MDMAGHLVLSRELGEGVFIGDAHIKVARLSDTRVKLYITAPEEVNIRRDEVPARVMKTHGDAKPRFDETHCSQCGRDLGPGDSGKSHCDQHRNKGVAS
jgi:carbon storage regulator CsrA